MKPLMQMLCIALALSTQGWNVTAKETPPMPGQPSTLCVGRFAIDLPAGAKASIDASYHYIDPLQPKPVDSFDDVKQQLAAKAKKFESHKVVRDSIGDQIFREGGNDPDKLYGTSQLVGSDFDGTKQQAILSYHPEPSSPLVITEMHKIVDQWDYIFQSKDGGADSYPKTRRNMWAAVSRFTALSRRVIPSNPGFCVDGGYFGDDGKPPVKENFTLVVKFPDRPDVQFTIDANAIDRVNTDEPSLKHRVDGELNILRANVEGHVGVIERGALKAAGQDGYQIGISAPSDGVPGARIRKFFWSADGVPNDVTRPFMEIDLTIQPTDNGTTTVKDDAEAKALWDQLIGSLRIRPGAV